MNRGIRSPPRLVALVASVLAVVAAVGAVSPRLRASGRDRVVRAGVARASTQRSDGSRGWVAPIEDHDPAVAAVHSLVRRQAAPPGDDERRLALLARGAPLRFLAPTPFARPQPLPARPSLRLTAGLIRAAAGRAPPLG